MQRPLRWAAILLLAPVLVSCSQSSDAREDTAPTPKPKPSPTLAAVPGGLGPEFFGMHDADPVGDSWPAAPVGSLRVWDSGVVWNQVETTPGRYDFSRLDDIVQTARKHQAHALVVLGQTPAFHSRHPKKVGSYGPGASSMPNLAAWTAYVRAVVERYAADDVAFQVWNEVNVEGYWSGTPRQMARLTAAARTVVDTVTPAPTLVAPAMATRTLGQRGWLRLFYGQRVGGVPVADLTDVVSLQLYPEVGEGPERSATLLTEARRIIALQGVAADKPIWDTEINYGLQGGEPATPISTEQQQANVAKTFLINAAGGMERVYWYAWDLHAIADTDLVQADNATLSPAGRAFKTVQRWMLGTRVTSCNASPNGTWVCVLQAPEGSRRVVWNTEGSAAVRTAFDATSAERLGEPATMLPLGGSTFQVGETPVLVVSDASSSSTLPPRL